MLLTAVLSQVHSPTADDIYSKKTIDHPSGYESTDSAAVYTEKNNTSSDQVLLSQARCSESISFAGKLASFICITFSTVEVIQMVSTDIWTWVSLVLDMDNHSV